MQVKEEKLLLLHKKIAPIGYKDDCFSFQIKKINQI